MSTLDYLNHLERPRDQVITAGQVVQLDYVTGYGYRGVRWADWAWSSRPDLWPAGHHYVVEQSWARLVYAGATYGHNGARTQLAKHRVGEGPGVAEADILAGRITVCPWPEP